MAEDNEIAADGFHDDDDDDDDDNDNDDDDDDDDDDFRSEGVDPSGGRRLSPECSVHLSCPPLFPRMPSFREFH
jgi:hypothetical protein